MTRSRLPMLPEAATSVTARFIPSLGMQAIPFPAVGPQSGSAQNLRLVLAFEESSMIGRPPMTLTEGQRREVEKGSFR